MKKEKDNQAVGADGKVPRSAVRKAYWYYEFFRGGGGYTYNMAANLASAMGFILRPLYKTKERIGEEMKKYYFYFDTNVPFVGAVAGLLIGIVCGLVAAWLTDRVTDRIHTIQLRKGA